MRWISSLSALEVSRSGRDDRQRIGGIEARDFFADHANVRLGGNGIGDAPRKLDAIDGQRMSRRNSRFIRQAQERGSSSAHLLLQQPWRGVRGLAFE